jgi:hypothetical protein
MVLERRKLGDEEAEADPGSGKEGAPGRFHIKISRSISMMLSELKNFAVNEEHAKLNHNMALRAVRPNYLFSKVIFS